jgi:hypothetical protein
MTQRSLHNPGVSMRRLASLLLLLAAAGCSADVTLPVPVLKGPTEQKNPPPVDPGIVCNAQQDTTVTLHGDKLAPIPIDIPDDPKVALPTVTLTRSLELGGGKAPSKDVIVWSGDPDADTTNTESADGKPLLTWKSQKSMSFVVQPELTLEGGNKGPLSAGVYDVEALVRNASASMKPRSRSPSPAVRCCASVMPRRRS